MRAQNQRLRGSCAGDGRARETPLPTSVDPPRCGACAGLGLRMRRGHRFPAGSARLPAAGGGPRRAPRAPGNPVSRGETGGDGSSWSVDSGKGKLADEGLRKVAGTALRPPGTRDLPWPHTCVLERMASEGQSKQTC